MKIISFLKILIKKPKEVSAFIPTLKNVAETVALHIPADSLNIAEYGPGSGVVTQKILDRVGPEAQLLAIEILEDFVVELKKIKDERFTIIHGNSLEESKKLKENSFDAILTSIPLSMFSKKEREEIIQTSHKALKSGGKLIVYYQSMPVIFSSLRRNFGKVKWYFEPRNFTLYFVFVAEKQ